MKNIAVFSIIVVALASTAEQSQAIPAFAKAFTERYVNTSKNAEFVTAVKQAKCNLCHFGTSKRNKNDFGKTFAKHLKRTDYNSTRFREEAATVKKEFDVGLKKILAEKNPAGKTYQSRIENGELPGTVEQ
ncbi:MAG: hypothetical protein CMJ76_16070 [Planctomycetaceae bacterium]|nr:hypothetical protein [Planctomycetaceae bacterium]|tara:strand:+ start:280 stop:672 length:393 start_codon:yes stop_codon:yes gene_type:complete